MWKTISNYPNYEVNDKGEVRHIKFNRILKPQRHSNGYLIVNLPTSKTIHRLVAEAFILNSDDKPHINHIDGDKTNNHIDNLEWCTRSENMNHARENGLLGFNKYVLQFNLEGELVNEFTSIAEAAKAVNGTRKSIALCCEGKIYKKHKGFVWKYRPEVFA